MHDITFKIPRVRQPSNARIGFFSEEVQERIEYLIDDDQFYWFFVWSLETGLRPSESFHLEAVAEMCRVAREVRIFPLLALSGDPSPHVGVVSEAVEAAGWAVRVESVPYEFQRGGSQMMRISRKHV